jgi:osmotically inducible protein OsmC
MTKSSAVSEWKGSIMSGKGTLQVGKLKGTYDFTSRFEGGPGSSPEEMIGSAHSACFSMYLSLIITEQGYCPDSIITAADVTVDMDEIGPVISRIDLSCKVKCNGLTESELDRMAAITHSRCPVSRLYSGSTAQVNVTATLV